MLNNKKIYNTTILFFLVIILLGTLILQLPICNTFKTNFIDSLFEATSAVSGTGTTVLNISKDYTIFGQFVMLFFIQLGAIGFMMFYSFLFLMNKNKMKLSDVLVLSNKTNIDNLSLIKIKTQKIIKYTFIIEFIGCWLLSFKFIPMYGFTKGLWYSIFHSISSFCNSGFDIFGANSLNAFNGDIYVYTVIILLMFFGSLGFFVLEDLVECFTTGKKNKVSIQSLLILKVTFGIIIIGSILIKIFNPQLSIFDIIFTSISARNTGFTVFNMNGFSEMNKVIISTLMFIGGGAASNAGGLKISVFAVLLLTTISNLKDRKDVVISYKVISEKIVKKAITILIVDIFIVIVGVMLLILTDGRNFLDTLFYVTSSFSTTGLSTIDASELSFIGKCVSILIMFIGTIAPMTFLTLFISEDKKSSQIKYPEIDLVL